MTGRALERPSFDDRNVAVCNGRSSVRSSHLERDMRWRVLLLLLLGCGRKLTYLDDVDTTRLKTSFRCAPSLTGDRADACRILDDFASAGPFTSAPMKGMETWFGRKVCTDAIDAPDRIDFGQIHLKPGVGQALWPDDVKTEPSRDLPYGAQFIGTGVGQIKPTSLRLEYQKTLAAAEKGTTPDFSNLEKFDRDRMIDFWNSVKKPPGTTLYVRLVQSKGASVLGDPYTSDAKERPSANYFLRGKGDRMLVIYPSTSAPCVAELWKIYTE